MDYIIARKVLKKFESMNISFVRDEITELINYIDKVFGKEHMQDSRAYLKLDPESVLTASRTGVIVCCLPLSI